MVGESLLRLDLSENELSHMEDGALSGLEQLLLLNISRNDLGRFNSDVFKGAHSNVCARKHLSVAHTSICV